MIYKKFIDIFYITAKILYSSAALVSIDKNFEVFKIYTLRRYFSIKATNLLFLRTIKDKIIKTKKCLIKNIFPSIKIKDVKCEIKNVIAQLNLC